MSSVLFLFPSAFIETSVFPSFQLIQFFQSLFPYLKIEHTHKGGDVTVLTITDPFLYYLSSVKLLKGLYITMFTLMLKALMSITFLYPRAQQEVVIFWCQIKPHIFLIITQNFQLIAVNVLISGIPILIFICIFITASSPSVKYLLFCPRRENKK